MSASESTFNHSPATQTLTVTKPFINPTRVLIDRFPVEILLRIFQLGSDVLAPQSEPGWELVISWVCKRWRMIALDHGRFWTTINFCEASPFPKARIYLQRSKNAPLTVDLSKFLGWHSRRNANDEGRFTSELSLLEEALSLVLPHAHRWQAFLCTVFYRSHMMFVLDELAKCSGAPVLEVLYLNNANRRREPSPFQPSENWNSVLFHGDVPKLRQAWLTDIPITSDMFPFLKGLNALALRPDHFFHQDDHTQYADILRILCDSPELTKLTIGGFRLSQLPGYHTPGSIQLHLLTEIHIRWIPASHLKSIFALLSMPRLTALNLFASATRNHLSDVMESLCEPHPSTNFPVLERIEQLSLRWVYCSATVMQHVYRTMQRVRELTLEPFSIQRQPWYLDLLSHSYSGGQSTDIVSIPCSALESITLLRKSKASVNDIRELVQGRIDMGKPLKKLRIESLPVDDSDVVWLRQRVEEVEIADRLVVPSDNSLLHW